jgi:hypothetical protein
MKKNENNQSKIKGRPPLSDEGESPKVSFRLTYEQQAKLTRIGGARFLREQIDNAVDPDDLIDAPF